MNNDKELSTSGEQESTSSELPTAHELMTAKCEIQCSFKRHSELMAMGKRALVNLVIAYSARLEIICNILDKYHAQKK